MSCRNIPGTCAACGFPISDYPPAHAVSTEVHDASIRNITLDEMIKLSMLIEENETERWENVSRPKNDGYINGSHSGYGHALRDMRQWIDRIKMANGGLKI